MRGRRNRSALVVGLLTALLAFVAVVQVRSQAEVVRTLEGQDSTALAFLIDDLHRANDDLEAQAATLAGRRDALGGGSGSEAENQLGEEALRLRVIEGLVPVHGPGVVVTVDAPLTPLDLEDAVNNLRVASAEAVAVNDRRVIMGTAFRLAGDSIEVDGTPERGPWTLVAIGDPGRLGGAADQMTRALRADPRVRRADYRSVADLAIRSTVVQRPFVYGSA
jgi:uncharacterized protein YlxW (UPF0749 family)